MKTRLRRLFPHPLLSLMVLAVWMMLVNRFAWGSLVFAAILAVVIPLATAPYWQGVTRFRKISGLVGFAAVVGVDIVKANLAVAKVVLFLPKSALRPAFISVPLDLRHPEAITMLASAVTLTPGTVSCDLSESHDALLVHCLHAPDPDAVRDEIKTRYEARLKEIFP